MYSEAISNIFNGSGMESAIERTAKIEQMIIQYNDGIQEKASVNKMNPSQAGNFAELIKPPLPELNKISGTQSLPVFEDTLNATNINNLKFRVVPPPTISKGYIESLVKQTAQKYDVDEKLVMAIIKQESNFNPNAVSQAGAKGLMQLMPSTASRLGINNVFDPQQNLDGGVRHLKGLLARYNGNLVLTLAAYNAGGGNVDKYGGVPPFRETQNYVRNILSNYLSDV